MIKIAEYLTLYPTIRLCCGYQVTFKSARSTRIEGHFGVFIVLEYDGFHVYFKYDDIDDTLRFRRHLRREIGLSCKEGT